MIDLVIRSRRTVTPEGERAAAVAVRGEKIAALYDYAAPLGAAEDVDLRDLALLPGLVDTHVHVNEPGRTHWEGFDSATRAAAAGGVTTIIDMPLNSVPPTVNVPALEAKLAAARGRCHVDVGFWGGAVPGNVKDLGPLRERGVHGFKCFMSPSGVDEFPPLSLPELREALSEVAAVGGVMVVHAEDPALLSEPGGPTYREFLDSRPGESERSAVAAVVRLAGETGARVHVLHVSSAACLDVLERARQDGVAVTAETCPHYLTLAAEQVPEGATAYKCCPPIRSGANRDLLWDGLGRGVLTCVVSDHSPSPADLKVPDFAAAWGGIASLQLGLPAVWTEASTRGYALADVARWMSAGPASMAGISGKGAIAVGKDADLVAFDPAAGAVVDASRLHHRHPVTPYDGRRLKGAVLTTWLRGRPVDGVPHGRFLWGER